MFLPYFNYTQPMSLCILGLQETTHSEMANRKYVSLGQRALAHLPFYAIFDRSTNTATIELGGAVENGENCQNDFYPVVVAISLIGSLLVLICYLIYLRCNRLKAEEWLEKNRHILFNHANKLKSEEELLAAILQSPKLQSGVKPDELGTPKQRRTSIHAGL